MPPLTRSHWAALTDAQLLAGCEVDTYRASLMRKLDIHDVAGLVKFAIQHKLITMQV